jgi:predicted DNA-binding transcriptional regulator AlpA
MLAMLRRYRAHVTAGPTLRFVEDAEFLAGPAEIAKALGVHANTINQWKARHEDFPKPVRVLKLGSIWDLREVAAWAQRTGRLEQSGSADPI